MSARTNGPATSWSIAVSLDLTFVQEAVNTSWSPLNASLLLHDLCAAHCRPPSGLQSHVSIFSQLCLYFVKPAMIGVYAPRTFANTTNQDELKNKTVCEGQELKLHCHESKFLNIYSATYGRRTRDGNICSPEPQQLPPFDRPEFFILRTAGPTSFLRDLRASQAPTADLTRGRAWKEDCLSYSALQVLSRRCYGKQRCTILVNNYHFGRPCLPGVKMYLTVTYACVPKNILGAIDPAITNLKPSLKQKDGEYDINFNPSGSRVLPKDGVIVSNSLAAFAYIRAHPERAALLFVSSVCVGLVITLCALVIRVSCTKDLRELQQGREHLALGSDQVEEDSEEDGEQEPSSDSDFPRELSGVCRTSYPAHSSTEAAELAERIERREQIMQEIWMNSGVDASLPRHLGQFY
ncbi:protein eva-1 homolog C isoform 3-T4 [Thomomys bottae]